MTLRRLVAAALLTVAASATSALAQPAGGQSYAPPPPDEAPLAPEGAAQGPVTHTDQLVVVTPNAPVVITNGGPGQTAPRGAGAAPAGVQAPWPAPINESWDNVSHINGTPVKVGERNDYLLKYKKLNISTNPIGWMFGIYGLSLSEAISPNVAIRGDANLFDIAGFRGYELGISAPIFFRRVYSGPFIEPGLIVRGSRNSSVQYAAASASCEYDCGGGSSSSDTDKMVGPEVLFGWSWIFDSGLNVSMAFGAARDLSSGSGSSDPAPAGYFRIGYAM